ncbi:MAG: D-alanine--D-alanine ligase [Fimbriimonadaceae bacterium]|nr:D-alanine--D-alanine ligase [Fimbriimonadaceae bacterium]
MTSETVPPVSRPVQAMECPCQDPSDIARWVAGLGCPSGRRVLAIQPFGHTGFIERLPDWQALAEGADVVAIADLAPDAAGPLPGVGVALLVEKLHGRVLHVPCPALLPRTVAAEARPGDQVLFVGHPGMADARSLFEDELVRLERAPEVVVVYGGVSAEREVSLHSGREVYAALVRRGYRTRMMDVSQVVHSGGDLSDLLGTRRPDVAFLACHGSQAEDGCLQGFFEVLGIPYTGSGVLASALAMDKAQTKRVLAEHGLPVPTGVHLRRGDPLPEPFGKAIVKPNAQGSTIGLSFASDWSEVPRALDHAFRYDESVLLEEWVVGTEVSVPVLGDRVLPVVEIVPASGRYDFASKYQPEATLEIVPARLTPEQTALAQSYALRAHQALGCRGATRTDMIVSADRIVVLEVNNLPGMTSTSLLPNSARAAGIGFDELVCWIVEEARTRHAQGKVQAGA